MFAIGVSSPASVCSSPGTAPHLQRSPCPSCCCLGQAYTFRQMAKGPRDMPPAARPQVTTTIRARGSRFSRSWSGGGRAVTAHAPARVSAGQPTRPARCMARRSVGALLVFSVRARVPRPARQTTLSSLFVQTRPLRNLSLFATARRRHSNPPSDWRRRNPGNRSRI